MLRPLADFLRLMLLLALVFFLWACGDRNGRLEAEGRVASEALPIVPVVKVVRSDLANTLVVTGEFIPYQEIDVMAKEAGYIKSIRVDIGDRVHTGELLAELEIPEMQDEIAGAKAGVAAAAADIEAAQGNVNRAKSAYDIADLSYKRILDVANKEPGLIPRQEVDVAHSKQLETSAQAAAAKANLETAQRRLGIAQAEQARWNTLRNYTFISAPFNGVVTKRYANTGAMIQQGTASETQAMPVVRLSQNNLLRLIVPIPESAVPLVRIGETVDVTVSALARRIKGRVTRFEDKISLATRTMNTEIDVPNPDYVLVPGMYTEVNLQMRRSQEALAVPLEAVEENGGSAQLYTVRDSAIRIIPVTTGVKTARQQEIKSGVEEGELIVVGRHADLQSGEKVQPKLVHYDDAQTPQGS